MDETDRAADALAETLAATAAERKRTPRPAAETLLGGLVHGPEEGPRGLSPAALLAAAAGAQGLEMDRLAAALRPPARGPWYRTAQEAEPGAPAARLSVALAAWALRRGAPDAAFLAAAAGSLARLTDPDPGARADACLLALVAQAVAVSFERPRGVDTGLREGVPLAARFGGAPPSGRLAPVWSALRRHPEDPEAAAAACAREGGDPKLASAVAGLGSAVEPSPRAAALRAALESIRAADDGGDPQRSDAGAGEGGRAS